MKIRVLVVDDSAFMRKVVTDMVNSSGKIEVIDTAKNGKEAVEKARLLKPDVITLDVEMPIMDGLTALEHIMKENPIPVLMLSSLTHEGAEATIRSLELGAIDFIAKPSSILKVNTDDMKIEIVEKIIMASRARIKFIKPIVRAERPKIPTTEPIKPSIPPTSYPSSAAVSQRVARPQQPYMGSGRLDKIVAIGTSTGGPRALQSVIPNLPKNLNAGVLIVQHMPAGFTKSLAERMDSMSEVTVKEAEDGDLVKAGHVYIAPGNFHMRLEKAGGEFRIRLSQDGQVSGHRPSVDAMMYSIANLNTTNIIGVIMTGMGADGAKGLVEVKKKNKGYIIAQDEDSCVVWGMPKSTIDLGVVDRVVPLNDIVSEILKAMEV